jgi:TonB family protein
MAAFWLKNLMAYAAQIAILALAGGLALRLLRMRIPKIRLLCWQTLLAAALLLPLIPARRPWDRASLIQISTSPVSIPAPARQRESIPLPSPLVILLALGVGIAARSALLCLGSWRIYRYRRNAEVLPGAFQALRNRMAVRADIQVSNEISGPVTFGFLRPAILLPPSALDDEAIACHELVHVRRRDWLYTVFEESILAVFWFHPALWWLVSEIQLAREQSVDQEVVTILSGRERYLESLLTLAAAKAGVDLTPASSFLRKKHLKKRIESLLKEASMSRLRLSSSLATFAVALLVAGWLNVRAFPLQAAPQEEKSEPGVHVRQNGMTLLHRAPVQYPQEAREKRIQGTVVAELTLTQTGTVADAVILSGPEELRKAALESVLQWHYATDGAALPAKTQVTVDFQLPPDSAAPAIATPRIDSATTVRDIVVLGPDVLKERVLNRLTLKAGDTLTQSTHSQLLAEVKDVDEHLRVTVRPTNEHGAAIIISLAGPPETPQRIRVGGNVQAANLIEKVTPKYPVEAKQARIQGKVSFTATIGKDGKVENLELISGEPVLADAAREAVAQWVYKPTLLNGLPVQVVTQVDVNFTLAQ